MSDSRRPFQSLCVLCCESDCPFSRPNRSDTPPPPPPHSRSPVYRPRREFPSPEYGDHRELLLPPPTFSPPVAAAAAAAAAASTSYAAIVRGRPREPLPRVEGDTILFADGSRRKIELAGAPRGRPVTRDFELKRNWTDEPMRPVKTGRPRKSSSPTTSSSESEEEGPVLSPLFYQKPEESEPIPEFVFDQTLYEL